MDLQMELGKKLSTPSLGITWREFLKHRCIEEVSFQLPLSGSRHEQGRVWFVVGYFQLPLSGSRASHPRRSWHYYRKSFNSLSRDHRETNLISVLGKALRLSTPSLGITDAHSWVGSLGVHWKDFQLPLSGSPSPIPGFFGSPRLSAAAPLRTNDF